MYIGVSGVSCYRSRSVEVLELGKKQELSQLKYISPALYPKLGANVRERVKIVQFALRTGLNLEPRVK